MNYSVASPGVAITLRLGAVSAALFFLSSCGGGGGASTPAATASAGGSVVAAPDLPLSSAPGGWTQCAVEGEVCVLPGAR